MKRITDQKRTASRKRTFVPVSSRKSHPLAPNSPVLLCRQAQMTDVSTTTHTNHTNSLFRRESLVSPAKPVQHTHANRRRVSNDDVTRTPYSTTSVYGAVQLHERPALSFTYVKGYQRVSKVTALFLVLFFVLVPVSDAHASELDVSVVTIVDETTTDNAPKIDQTPMSILADPVPELTVSQTTSTEDDGTVSDTPTQIATESVNVESISSTADDSSESLSDAPQDQGVVEVAKNTTDATQESVSDVVPTLSVETSSTSPVLITTPIQEFSPSLTRELTIESELPLNIASDITSVTPSQNTVSTQLEDEDSSASTTSEVRTTTSAEDTSISNDIQSTSTSDISKSGTDEAVTGASGIPTSTPDVIPIIPDESEPLIQAVTEDTTSTSTTVSSLSEVASTSSDDATPPSTAVVTHTTELSAYTFSESECVAIGDGTYQCIQKKQVTDSHVSKPLYVEKDADGDMEIFRTINGEKVKVTDNTYDDSAPSLDIVTGDLVWHAQIDDRFQIMHAASTGEGVNAITKEAYNSMNPSSSGGDIVFQSWIGNDWEIVLIDRIDGRIVLTDNDVNDVAPSITADYIMWQSEEEGEWVARVYNRKTSRIETVRGIAGDDIQNPRMIMVFDSTNANGDIETMGYDPVLGETVPLAVTPVPLSERVPEPEEKQEEKALIQPNAQPRVASEEESEASVPGGDTPTDGSSASSTLIHHAGDAREPSQAQANITTGTGSIPNSQASVVDMRGGRAASSTEDVVSTLSNVMSSATSVNTIDASEHVEAHADALIEALTLDLTQHVVASSSAGQGSTTHIEDVVVLPLLHTATTSTTHTP
jgi:hypothetical protein